MDCVSCTLPFYVKEFCGHIIIDHVARKHISNFCHKLFDILRIKPSSLHMFIQHSYNT